ncbi:hypothetical protein EW145_g5981 [Phellinidium pouzarii]|uniref:F-box domain-containing protein n=1 Tax=Phellinidium pouzarii TaxID=167371 RepID=A0A4S4KYC8_9AGAM|nr:hypothetical protein EW145_g5981 [Phellinidium pouzarii]
MRSRSLTTTHARSASLSGTLALTLPWHPSKSFLETLPTEILLDIVQVAAVSPRRSLESNSRRLSSSDSDSGDEQKEFGVPPGLDRRTLCALALTSRIISAFAHAVLYRTASIYELKAIELFSRTTVTSAHRDITLFSATSPIAPSLSSQPASPFLGKSTTRLVLDTPFPLERGRTVSTSRIAHRLLEEQDRFYAAAGALLGLGPSAPSVPSPILASLRTLVIDSEILAHHLKHSTPPLHFPVSPAPSELILSTFLPTSEGSSELLAPLSAHLTHLIVALPPAKWSPPSTTLSSLGGVPSLTHVAFVRRANANEDNDMEFIRDVERVLSERRGTLECVVLVVMPDTRFSSSTTRKGSGAKRKLDSATQALEEYLHSTFIWTKLSALARSACPDIVYRRGAPAVCVVPGRGDAWERSMRNSQGSGVRFTNNVYLDIPESGGQACRKRLVELGEGV